MKSCTSRGFTLVEILVASAIIALSLVSVVAFVRKGQELIAIDKHRRMARGIIERTLENGQYQPESYNNLVTTTTTTTVTIDAETTPIIQGSLVVAVGDSVTRVNGIAAPYRPVTATVTWTSGNSDTLSITKWITNVQRD